MRLVRWEPWAELESLLDNTLMMVEQGSAEADLGEGILQVTMSKAADKGIGKVKVKVKNEK
ncbi:MAG: hypothetical protein A3E37_05640 [Candidatus Andersenbacteria bacterium RIFCSPHIGHO2_12_FULL_46_9]|nr:MAG: hypothetical protein UW94_C0001G0062 [Parcubacteria group bacterium GW2011_GWA2_45_14]OGY35785.1 MAG: hypothetical protein A3B76_03680 [Candidatus Andersenbacteria bacterium RIFCSPHIGHO2_02_FULL_46_16]OGY36662.1 MAG: hypothetical protein A3I08_00010 [Candidatus Andersenbacteria bacterium RIFCSPLOWO2_02_FULL_46_11]OGY37835.1 MAG: hypothetical protein A3E37_05640 [Candidatus Andersenbacteria bacterium RIFCSPHIGHO2_12_FULL_46_9]HBE90467.1 hypothetical protein [Candidatus Andersenbacteria b